MNHPNPTDIRFALRIFIFTLASIFFMSCDVKPEPLNYGKDPCHHCKMTLTDIKFGAELVTSKGKVYKFDDINCMVNFLNSGTVDENEMAFKLIIDYTQPGKLIPVSEAFYLKSDSIRAPMNSEIAAFETEKTMKEYKKKWKAIYLGWGELQTEFK